MPKSPKPIQLSDLTEILIIEASEKRVVERGKSGESDHA